MAKTSGEPEIDWSFAARRLASGQSAMEVAAMFRVAEARIEALLADPAFQTLVESYRKRRAKTREERAEERQELVEDALDWLIEQRNVRAVL